MGYGARILDRWLNRRESWVLILGIGLILRLAALVLVADDPLVGDSKYYMETAVEMLRGDFHSDYWPPGLPLFEAGLMYVFGEEAMVLRIAMLFVFIWLCRVTYQFMYRIHSRPAANLTLAFLCIYPELIHHSVEPLTQLPTATLLMVMVNQTAKLQLGGRFRPIRNGIALALMTLVRPSSLSFLGLLPAWLAFRMKRISLALVMVVAFLAVLAAWYYSTTPSYSKTPWINEANARNLYLGNNPWTPDYKTWYFGSHWTGEQSVPQAFAAAIAQLDAMPRPDRAKAYMDAAKAYITAHPMSFVKRTFSRIRTFFVFDTFTGSRIYKHHNMPGLGLTLIILSAVLFTGGLTMAAGTLLGALPGELHRGIRMFILWLIPFFGVAYWIAFSHPTYHIPLLPVMAGLAAIPTSIFLMPMGRPAFKQQARRRWIWAGVVVIILAIQVEWVLQMMP